MTYREAHTAWQRAFLSRVLQRHHGNQCSAAAELDMHRNTLSRILELIDLDANTFKKPRRAAVSVSRRYTGDQLVKRSQFVSLLRESHGSSAASEFLDYPPRGEDAALRIHGERLGPVRDVHGAGDRVEHGT